MSVVIEPVSAADLPALFALLEQSGLPQEGLRDHVSTTLAAREDQVIVGSAALEIYGTTALLRSVAVADHLRGQGVGQQLTNAALNLARQQGISQVYLLTETAALFFPRFGFCPIPRSEVSSAIHASHEWTVACPVTAQAMVANVAGDA
jgi:amino-acid N-acetyltransferase